MPLATFLHAVQNFMPFHQPPLHMGEQIGEKILDCFVAHVAMQARLILTSTESIFAHDMALIIE